MVSLTTCLIAGIHYLIHPQKLGSITATIKPEAILPITLLTTEEIFGGRLEQLLDEYAAVDDVFTPTFGAVLVEKVQNGTNSTASGASVDREIYHLEDTVTVMEQLYDLPSGPYILHGPNLYQAWRLYDDEYEAFEFGVIPENATKLDKFSPLNALSPDGAYKSIPVPSRLYYPNVSAKKPLSGVRFSIPDVMSLKGVQTTLSSKAWSSLYPTAASTTAEYAQKLMDLGAVIVGKTKVAPFASGNEWVDVEAPWSPRADEYQDPSGSSSGAAAALAAYEWLEYAVGEDAIDGLRSPAAADGVYALRPTFSNSSLDGVRVSSSQYDNIDIAARSLDELLNATMAVLSSTDSSKAPKKIAYLTDIAPDLPPDQADIVDDFVSTVEKHLDVKAERLSLADAWDKKPPSGADGQDLKTFMKDAAFLSFCYEYAAEYKNFQNDYNSRFDKDPFIETTPAFRLGVGANVTEDQYKSNLKKIEVFKSWFEDNVVPTDSSAVAILSYGSAKPHYRQDEPGSPKTIEGLTAALLGPILGAPQLVVPFDQISYQSEISGRSEQLPVSASLIGSKDSEASLIELAKKSLELAKRETKVNTGRFTFPLSKGTRKASFVDEISELRK